MLLPVSETLNAIQRKIDHVYSTMDSVSEFSSMLDYSFAFLTTHVSRKRQCSTTETKHADELIKTLLDCLIEYDKEKIQKPFLEWLSKKGTILFLQLVMDNLITWRIRLKALSVFVDILSKVDKPTLQDIRNITEKNNEAVELITNGIRTLNSSGDFEIQYLILEVVLNLLCGNTRILLAKQWFTETSCLSSFLGIKYRTFGEDSRIFLNLVNNLNKPHYKIFSMQYKRLEVGDYVFDRDFYHGWIDLCYESRCIMFLNIGEDEDFVRLDKKQVEYCSVEDVTLNGEKFYKLSVHLNVTADEVISASEDINMSSVMNFYVAMAEYSSNCLLDLTNKALLLGNKKKRMNESFSKPIYAIVERKFENATPPETQLFCESQIAQTNHTQMQEGNGRIVRPINYKLGVSTNQLNTCVPDSQPPQLTRDKYITQNGLCNKTVEDNQTKESNARPQKVCKSTIIPVYKSPETESAAFLVEREKRKLNKRTDLPNMIPETQEKNSEITSHVVESEKISQDQAVIDKEKLLKLQTPLAKKMSQTPLAKKRAQAQCQNSAASKKNLNTLCNKMGNIELVRKMDGKDEFPPANSCNENNNDNEYETHKEGPVQPEERGQRGKVALLNNEYDMPLSNLTQSDSSQMTQVKNTDRILKNVQHLVKTRTTHDKKTKKKAKRNKNKACEPTKLEVVSEKQDTVSDVESNKPMRRSTRKKPKVQYQNCFEEIELPREEPMEQVPELKNITQLSKISPIASLSKKNRAKQFDTSGSDQEKPETSPIYPGSPQWLKDGASSVSNLRTYGSNVPQTKPCENDEPAKNVEDIYAFNFDNTEPTLALHKTPTKVHLKEMEMAKFEVPKPSNVLKKEMSPQRSLHLNKPTESKSIFESDIQEAKSPTSKKTSKGSILESMSYFDKVLSSFAEEGSLNKSVNFFGHLVGQNYVRNNEQLPIVQEKCNMILKEANDLQETQYTHISIPKTQYVPDLEDHEKINVSQLTVENLARHSPMSSKSRKDVLKWVTDVNNSFIEVEDPDLDSSSDKASHKSASNEKAINKMQTKNDCTPPSERFIEKTTLKKRKQTEIDGHITKKRRNLNGDFKNQELLTAAHGIIQQSLNEVERVFIKYDKKGIDNKQGLDKLLKKITKRHEEEVKRLDECFEMFGSVAKKCFKDIDGCIKSSHKTYVYAKNGTRKFILKQMSIEQAHCSSMHTILEKSNKNISTLREYI